MTPILMRIIPVTTFPLAASYDSFEAAIAGAKNNPRQPIVAIS